jgi:capsular polysaccharide biosynthesis protein
VASGSGDKRIYVSRQQVPAERGRKVLNYETLERVLDEFRFESYTVEELPFAEQVQLFADADVIMGPHGAGLFNMIFSENPTIVELFPEGMLRPYFYFIAEMMNFEYAGVVTDAVGEDIRVDVDQLRQRLDATGL